MAAHVSVAVLGVPRGQDPFQTLIVGNEEVTSIKLSDVPESCLSSITKLVAEHSSGKDASGALNAARLILARNSMKNTVVAMKEDGCCLIRTRRAATSTVYKPSKLRNQVFLPADADAVALDDTQQQLQQSTATNTTSPCSMGAGSEDYPMEKAADATPTSGVTSISTTSRDASQDSDDDFTLRPDDVLLDQFVGSTGASSSSSLRQGTTRQPTPFEVPSILSSVLSFCPIQANTVPETQPYYTVEPEPEEDVFDIGSSVETVTSGTPSCTESCPSVGPSTSSTPDCPPPTASDSDVFDYASLLSSGLAQSSAPAQPEKSLTPSKNTTMKNTRARLLAAESENLPSPKQPKSPMMSIAGGLTPVGASLAAAATPGLSNNASLTPCDSPTMPSAVFGSSRTAATGAFTRRVFRSQSNQAMM